MLLYFLPETTFAFYTSQHRARVKCVVRGKSVMLLRGKIAKIIAMAI